MEDRRSQRGLRDEAGVGPDPRNAVSLVPLSELGKYRVAAGEPDIRGWTVFTATGREIGEIQDLLVDTDNNEVVMLDIDLKRDDRHSFAPIKAAWIDRTHRRVILNSQYLVNDEDVPALHRRVVPADHLTTAATDDEVRRFNEQYDRAYGADGWDRDREIHVRGKRDDLRLRRPSLPPSAEPTPVVARDVEVLTDTEITDREVRFPTMREVDEFKGGDPFVIEETVTRRRVVDPAELTEAERAELRARTEGPAS
jgi:sporulation protein YlmC with PRC-barrel domain